MYRDRNEAAIDRPRKHQQLFQVNVEDTKGHSIAVGPAMMEGACAKLASSIAEQIKLGREKRWSNPHIVPIINRS